MRKRLVTVLLGFWLLGQPGWAEETSHFQFEPPTDRPLVERLRRVRLELGPDGKLLRRDEWQLQMQMTARRTLTGWQLVRQPTGFSREGKAVRQLASLLKGTALVEETDWNGQLVRLRGFEQFAARVCPVAERKSCAEQLTAVQITLWNDRVGALAGQDYALGDTTVDRLPLVLEGRRAGWFYTATKFAAEIPCGASTCLKLEFAIDTEPADLGFAIGQLPLWQPAGFIRPEIEVDLSGSGHRVIDPRTMLVYSEYLTRRIRTRPVRGDGRWRTVIEQVEYSWK